MTEIDVPTFDGASIVTSSVSDFVGVIEHVVRDEAGRRVALYVRDLDSTISYRVPLSEGWSRP